MLHGNNVLQHLIDTILCFQICDIFFHDSILKLDELAGGNVMNVSLENGPDIIISVNNNYFVL